MPTKHIQDKIEIIARLYTEDIRIFPHLIEAGMEGLKVSQENQKKGSVQDQAEDTEQAIHFFISKMLAELKYNWLFEAAIKDLEEKHLADYISKMFVLITLAWGLNKKAASLSWEQRAQVAADSFLMRAELQETIKQHDIFSSPVKHFSILKEKEPELFWEITSAFEK